MNWQGPLILLALVVAAIVAHSFWLMGAAVIWLLAGVWALTTTPAQRRRIRGR